MIIGLLVDSIKADLGISDTQISLLQGLAFALFFTIAAIPLGRLIDRVHRPRAVSAGIAVWSAMTVACGFATSFAGLFVARMGVGVGEAVLSPAAYSMISDSFDRRRLGLAMGVFGLGSAIGAGLAFMIGGAVVSLVAGADSVSMPLIGEVRPWQFAFIVAGLPGFLVSLLFLLIRDPSHAIGARAAGVERARGARTSPSQCRLLLVGVSRRRRGQPLGARHGQLAAGDAGPRRTAGARRMRASCRARC